MNVLGATAITDASVVIGATLRPTPVVEMTDEPGEVLVKAESLQPTGSFKIRGALNKLHCLTANNPEVSGVVAYSTGNHAQAVALAARRHNLTATIVMSHDVLEAKIQATRRHGANIVFADPTSDARKAAAEELAERECLALVAPYDDYDVMAGQATIVTELIDQIGCHDATIYVPIGGGGLIAGVASAVRHLAPRWRVIGVEPELENDAFQSLRAGYRVSLDGPSASLADAIKVQTLGDLTYPIIASSVDDIVTVTESDIAAYTISAAEKLNLVVETSAAVALAAAAKHTGNRPAIAIATGGNITLDALQRLRQPL